MRICSFTWWGVYDMLVGTRLLQQQEGVLMHYSELQSRSAEVEAMASNFQKVVADEVAKARLRAKPGSKKGGIFKKKSGRGKKTRSEWNAQTPRQVVQIQWRRRGVVRKTRKTIYQRQWSCKFASS